MTRTRLILAIRCVTLLAVGALLFGTGWLYEGAATMLVGLMMPVLSSGKVCAGCDDPLDTSLDLQIDIAGVVNSFCSDCNNVNATYILDYNTVSDNCNYILITSKTLCGGSVTINVSFQWASPYRVLLIEGANNQTWDAGLSEPQDCTAVIASIANTTSTGIRCDYTASTATVTPL